QQSLPRLHRRLPRGASSPRATGRHLGPGSRRRLRAWPKRANRSRLSRAGRPGRRCLCATKPRSVAGMTTHPTAELANTPRAEGKPLIHMTGLRKVYRKKNQEFLAVSDVSMDIHEGDLISLVGPSGCGKSTLHKIL